WLFSSSGKAFRYSCPHASSALVVIASLGLFVYGIATFKGEAKPNGVLPDNLKTYQDWSFFTSGFLIGGLGGVLFACFLLLEIARAGIA
ncbi:photosystem I reaction center subunit XI, partial [Crocosphaera sp. Alani8]|uniref:photosystem I reaction center subunit XI n=1 Tax=Crocosphaera sp. Alani8 TaxID=3038952 RepID=UPI00313C6451